jgi:TonB family protein
MASAAKSSPEATPRSTPLKAPKLLIEWQPAPSAFIENFRAVLFRPTPVIWTSRPGTYWPDVFVRRPLAKREIALSYLLHGLAISIIYLSPWLGMLTHNPPTEQPPKDTTITYYKLSEYLPSIQSSSAPAKTPRKGEPALAKQPIVSVPAMPDNLEQTIVDPSSVAVLRQHVDVPNMVVMTPIPAAPITANPGVPKLTLPPEINVIAPASDPVSNQLAKMLPKLPDQQLVQPAADANDLETKLSDMNIARLDLTVAEPKITLTPVRALPKLAPGAGEGAAAPAPPPGSGTNANAVGQMIALGINPTLPSGPVNVPSGNRRGEFAAGPEGKARAPGTPEIKAGGAGNGGEGTKLDEGTGKNGDANFPGISVAGPASTDNASVIAAAAPPPPTKPAALSNAQKQLLASAAHPSMAEIARGTAAHRTLPNAPDTVEDKVFGTKKYYSMTLNMPNLTSAGGSWIVRFAELTETHSAGELTAPVALIKVDPAYPQDLMRDRVEGTVTVYAVIHSDGTVGELRVLRGVDDRLDANAMTALSHWRFRPGTKNGAPVELEAVVQIPFVLRKEPRY